MYSSYYASANQQPPEAVEEKKAIKATPQYLFLNMIRMFSIAYLLLTLFYIPVYIGIGQIHSLYFIEDHRQFNYVEKFLLQGTIFGIRNHQTCYPKIGEDLSMAESTAHEELPQLVQKVGSITQNKVCYQNRFQFLPYVNTVREFHDFYFYYFIFFYFSTFLGIFAIQRFNQLLYIQMEYPRLKNSVNSKLQTKKVYHLTSSQKLPIYFFKPIIIKTIEQLLNINQINNIKLSLNPLFQNYVQFQIKIKKLQAVLYKKQNQFKNQINEQYFPSTNQEIQDVKLNLQNLQLQKKHLQIKLQKLLRVDCCYHYNHFWVHFDSFQDVLKAKNFINNQGKQEKNANFINNKNNLKLDQTQFSDIIPQNIENQEIISFFSSLSKPSSKKQITDFIPNKNYEVLNQMLKVAKIIGGVILCLAIIICIDVLILMIQKNNFFSHATVLVVLVIQIILKVIIVGLSKLQRHWLESHQRLSIMLKMTLFIFFNLVIMLLIGNHNLGSWQLGKIVSTYEFSSINQKWFIKIGTFILVVVIIQIVYCNLRVYIEVFKNIFFTFMSEKVSSIMRIGGIKEKIKGWIKDFRKSYRKPIIDLEICYSEIVPIYMLGISFGYLFPILYPLMFIFSITIYHTHKNYIELYTGKVPFSKPILNDWALSIIHANFIGGLLLLYFIQEMTGTFLIVSSGLLILIFVIIKIFAFNLQSLVIQRLKMLCKEQRAMKNKEKIKEELTERAFKVQNELNVESKRELNGGSWKEKEKKEKEMERVLADIFISKSQYINQVHAQYYALYRQVIRRQEQFIDRL